jgi:diguanylate cyclase (GGDEF)-like protein
VIERLRTGLTGLLPEGRRLPAPVWQRRHRMILVLGLAQALLLGVFAELSGHGPWIAGDVTLIVAMPLLPAALPELNRKIRAAAATTSLMLGSVALVQLWTGVTEAHFSFFVMVGVVSLYQDWLPFGIGLLIVILHHGVMGTLMPHAVFGSHAAQGDPWLWAGIHGAFVLAASLAHLASWRLNEQQVLQDRLTGLANRTQLEERLTRLLAGEEPVTLLLLDLDDFRDVNDSRGHAAGDAVLIEVADRLRGCVRSGDLLVRLGGDEFAVVVADTPAVARAVGERVLTTLVRPVALPDGSTVTVTGSIGVASPADRAEQTTGALLRNADLAMYLAKSRGRNGLAVYADGMAEDARRRSDLQRDLGVATDDGQLRVFFQPVVRVSDGTTAGHEALVRWEHPERGLVPPVDFIPLAEETGLINGIGRWVLTEAVRQGAAWSTQYRRPLRMSVNLSPRQLFDGDVPALVEQVLADTGFPPGLLTLEVTEGVFVHDVDRVIGELDRLRALGVRIAIDDFGTGFSSLSYLRRLPADVLKIDRSFVTDLAAGGSSRSLVASIMELARTLGLDVIAEGVETEPQRRALEDLGCGLAQGYLFAPPRPAGDCVPVLTPAGSPLVVPRPR